MSNLRTLPQTLPDVLLTPEPAPILDLQDRILQQQFFLQHTLAERNRRLLWENDCRRVRASYYEGPLND